MLIELLPNFVVFLYPSLFILIGLAFSVYLQLRGKNFKKEPLFARISFFFVLLSFPTLTMISNFFPIIDVFLQNGDFYFNSLPIRQLLTITPILVIMFHISSNFLFKIATFVKPKGSAKLQNLQVNGSVFLLGLLVVGHVVVLCGIWVLATTLSGGDFSMILFFEIGYIFFMVFFVYLGFLLIFSWNVFWFFVAKIRTLEIISSFKSWHSLVFITPFTVIVFSCVMLYGFSPFVYQTVLILLAFAQDMFSIETIAFILMGSTIVVEVANFLCIFAIYGNVIVLYYLSYEWLSNKIDFSKIQEISKSTTQSQQPQLLTQNEFGDAIPEDPISETLNLKSNEEQPQAATFESIGQNEL